jgi:hypothetical protein
VSSGAPTIAHSSTSMNVEAFLDKDVSDRPGEHRNRKSFFD